MIQEEYPLTFLRAVEEVIKGNAVVRPKGDSYGTQIILQKDKTFFVWHNALFSSFEVSDDDDIIMFPHPLNEEDENAMWRLATKEEMEKLYFP